MIPKLHDSQYGFCTCSGRSSNISLYSPAWLSQPIQRHMLVLPLSKIDVVQVVLMNLIFNPEISHQAFCLRASLEAMTGCNFQGRAFRERLLIDHETDRFAAFPYLPKQLDVACYRVEDA